MFYFRHTPPKNNFNMEAKPHTTSNDDDELMDWETDIMPAASEVMRGARKKEAIDAVLYVYVKRILHRKSAWHRKSYDVSARVVDKKGKVVYFRALGKTHADWLTAEIRVGRWYAIQHVIFDYSGYSGHNKRWQHFRVRKDDTKIRELTAAETMAETTDAQPTKLLIALADYGELGIIGQFHGVWQCWEHYICMRCKSEKTGQDAVCPKCGEQSAGEYDWGGHCGVKLAKAEGNVESFVFSSEQLGGVLDSHLVRDSSKPPAEKLNFLIGRPVGILYRLEREKQGRKRTIDVEKKQVVKIVMTLCVVKSDRD